jgi:dephospho-CoA kinase
MIIGLTGTNGAGKGTIAEHLVKKGFSYYSLSDIIREEAEKRGLEKNRDVLIRLGNELRQAEGEGVLAKKVLRKIKGNSIVDSIRNPAEIAELKKAGNFILIAVDAKIELRYERIAKRKRPEDKVSFEEFRAQEEAELAAGKGKQQIKKCMELADYRIVNNGTLQELWKKVDKILRTN